MIDIRIAGLLVLGTLLSSACSSESTTSAADGGALDPKCNGHQELCGRRFDEVAVDFYDIGDLFDVVDALNGL